MSDLPWPDPSAGPANVGPEGFSEWTKKNPAPTPEMLEDPLFCAVWDAIKGWDIGCREYAGYAGAMGNHARAIFEAIRVPRVDSRAERQVAVLRELCANLRAYAKITLETAYWPSPTEEAMARAQALIQTAMVECVETNLDQTL